MYVFCWWSRSRACHSLALPKARLQELCFLKKNRKAVSFFYKYDKTKNFFEVMKDVVLIYRYLRLTWDWVKLFVMPPLNIFQEIYLDI